MIIYFSYAQGVCMILGGYCCSKIHFIFAPKLLQKMSFHPTCLSYSNNLSFVVYLYLMISHYNIIHHLSASSNSAFLQIISQCNIIHISNISVCLMISQYSYINHQSSASNNSITWWYHSITSFIIHQPATILCLLDDL